MANSFYQIDPLEDSMDELVSFQNIARGYSKGPQTGEKENTGDLYQYSPALKIVLAGLKVLYMALLLPVCLVISSLMLDILNIAYQKDIFPWSSLGFAQLLFILGISICCLIMVIVL